MGVIVVSKELSVRLADHDIKPLVTHVSNLIHASPGNDLEPLEQNATLIIPYSALGHLTYKVRVLSGILLLEKKLMGFASIVCRSVKPVPRLNQPLGERQQPFA
jgi:hypothetical protein